MKILSSLMHPCVVPNMSLFCETEEDILKKSQNLYGSQCGMNLTHFQNMFFYDPQQK